MIDQATIQRIKDTARIEEVVGDYVHLIRRGANYMGLCPFHNERTPSFSVNVQRNFCYCFSCRKGGSPINFIMEKEGISYHDALLHLAKRYGIEVEEHDLSDEEKQKRSARESMLVANEWAMQHFMKNLRETEEGRNVGLKYFYERKLTDEAINAFQLGYAIDRGNTMVEAARKAGFDLELLHQLGLIGKSKEGDRWYDRFRGRVIYPIRNSGGKVIAFGGRDLKGGMAKYINSPESEIYKKSHELYGIYQAKNRMSRDNEAYLVEGYMDVIGMWQSGMTNVVASSGTALTDGQINLLHRFARKVTLIYDGDKAGIKAALRGIDMLLQHKLEVKVLLLPDGHDPDSFAREHTPEEFREYVSAHAEDIIAFKTRILMDESGADAYSKSAAIRSIVHSIACVTDVIQQQVYIQQCASRFAMSEELIAAEVRKEALAVVEEQRQKRQISDIEQNRIKPGPSGEPGQVYQNNQNIQNVQSSPISPKAKTVGKPTILPFEKEVIRLCVRYAYMQFCEAADEQGNGTPLNVIDYVTSELEADEMRFETPVYARIFGILHGLRSEFDARYAEYYNEAEAAAARRRADGIADIASRDLAMSDIEREEKMLEERVAQETDDSLLQFILNYPARHLMDHEDDEVRATATELATDRHTTSKIFSRVGTVEPEHTQLGDRLPRAIFEWKDGILETRVRQIRDELRLMYSSGASEEEINEKMREMQKVQNLRKEISLFIGERILSPR